MKLKVTYPAEISDACNIDLNGWNFTLIYGTRNGNGFIAIPDWGVCSEASDPDDVFYNAEKLAACKCDIIAENAKELAQAVASLFGA